jgi:hypothetical protein
VGFARWFGTRAAFEGYEPVSGPPPIRRRTTANPLDREDYLIQLARGVR